jgi:hypothetical protein
MRPFGFENTDDTDIVLQRNLWDLTAARRAELTAIIQGLSPPLPACARLEATRRGGAGDVVT